MSEFAFYPLPCDFFRTKAGEYYQVYGTEHSNDLIFSRLIQLENAGYSKNQDLIEKKLRRQFFMKDIKVNDIQTYFMPRYIDEILELEIGTSQYSPQEINSAKFGKYLAENTGIPINSIVIPQSITTLKCKEMDKSHFNIAIFGLMNSTRVREFLRHQFEKKTENDIFSIRPYNYRELKKKYTETEISDKISFLDYLKYEDRKLCQGIANNHPFFIRFFEFDSRDIYKEKNRRITASVIHNLGKVRFTGEVRDNTYWWTTPSRVGIINLKILDTSGLAENCKSILKEFDLDLRDISHIYSADDRFIGNIRLLEQFHASGTLELIKSSLVDKRSYLRCTLGYDKSDFLKFL